MNRIAWTDFETGGLDPVAHDLTQIAVIYDVDGQVKAELNLKVRPSDPKRVTAGALAVQKRTLDEVMAHPLTQKQAYEAYRDFLEKNLGEMLASWGGQNVPFDVGFAKALFTANNDKLSRFFTAESVDLMHLVNDLRDKRKFMVRNAKLGTVCETLGIKFGAEGAHDAMADIRATREAFYTLRQKFPVPA